MSQCSQDQVEPVEYRRLATNTRFEYRAGADGSIWSLSTRKGAAWRRLKPDVDPAGYQRVQIGGKSLLVHRLILAAFSGPPADPAMVCRHVSDVKSDNRAANLVWGFPADNTADAFANGRMVLGSRATTAKLTEGDARAIVAAHRAGATRAGMARHYGVTVQTINNVLGGHTWSHATGLPYDPRSSAKRLTPRPVFHPATPAP